MSTKQLQSVPQPIPLPLKKEEELQDKIKKNRKHRSTSEMVKKNV